MATLTKREIRLEFINHPNSRGIIEDNFSEYYKYDEELSLYNNIVCFLEVVRVNKLWNSLTKVLNNDTNKETTY